MTMRFKRQISKVSKSAKLRSAASGERLDGNNVLH